MPSLLNITLFDKMTQVLDPLFFCWIIDAYCATQALIQIEPELGLSASYKCNPLLYSLLSLYSIWLKLAVYSARA